MTQQYGAIEFPLADQEKAADLLEPCDPVVARLSAFLKVFIEADIANALTGALEEAAPPVHATIRDVLTIDPSAETVDPKQVSFPLFCLWHKSSTFAERFINQPQRVSVLGWMYILPAMTVEQARKYAHVRSAVDASVHRAIYAGAHPNYNGGARVFSDDGIAEIRMSESTYDVHPFGELTSFYAVGGQLEVYENTRDDVAAYGDIDGVDFSIGVGGSTEIAPDLIQLDTSIPLQDP